MPEDRRTPGANVINELPAFDREESRAIGSRGEKRFAADSAKSAHRRIHPARNYLAGVPKEIV